MGIKHEMNILKPGSSNIRIIAFDTEDNSKGAPDNFLCATFYSENEQKIFFDRNEAREYIFKPRNGITIFFAHNLGYDLTNLDYPEGTAKQIISGSRLIGAYVKKDKKVIRFVDTGNFFVGASIKKLGKIFGDEKIDFDVSRIKNKTLSQLDEKTKNEMATYCLKDSRICYNTAKKLYDLTTNNNTRFKSFTAGSLALRIFRTNYMEHSWKTRYQHINNFERLAYYGGRTEVFNYNTIPKVFYEDINSSYPTAMSFNKFPKPWTYTIHSDLQWDDVKDIPGISLVTLEVPSMRIPPLPYKIPNGKLIFPIGTWSGAYTHPELANAQKYGVKINKVHQSILYGETFNPFDKYISFFHKKKSSSSGIEKDFYKMMMNSLSGKFGEKRTNTFRIKETDFKICYCDGIAINDKCVKCDGFKIGNKEIRPDGNGWITIRLSRLNDPKNSFPVLIAYITAYGRIKLYNDRLQYQDAIYCDTDSSVSEIDHPINRGNKLGEWDLKEYNNFKAYAPKFYTKDGDNLEVKLKGVPKTHTFLYTCNNNHTVSFTPCLGECKQNHFEIERCSICDVLLESNNKCFSYEKPMKLSEAIHRKKKPNEWNKILKTVSMDDNKRIKLANGDSLPLTQTLKPVSSFRTLLNFYS